MIIDNNHTTTATTTIINDNDNDDDDNNNDNNNKTCVRLRVLRHEGASVLAGRPLRGRGHRGGRDLRYQI